VAEELQTFTDPFKADEFAEKHVCSACWGLLIKTRPDPKERRWVMQCEDCGSSTKGYVTRRWAQQRAEVSRAELTEAKHALREAVPWLNLKKSESQILKELGVKS
jgi:hypothetical protein